LRIQKEVMYEEKKVSEAKKRLGVGPVFFTAISSILGAILFLRIGWATGITGFYGALAIIILGHFITIPTALAISELATNTRVEGGGEYFIISRSFGLKVGATIGITLFLSQAISIAFYTIAFAEAFQPLYIWCEETWGILLPRQVISLPTLLILAWIMFRKGTGSGVRLLYIVNGILFLSLLLFFLGRPVETSDVTQVVGNNFGFFNKEKFFVLFAICFPAFTGMTAGVGLSGDLKNPGKSIPLGTMIATLAGFIIYILVIVKFSISASQTDLTEDQLIMSRIALFGQLVIPIGLAAATSSSAIGFMMIAPRTLQAICLDRTFPFRRLNILFARGKGINKEPHNASLLSLAIAFVFVILGDVNTVAGIISMFFLITYGSLCLSSFLNHFGAPPSYRPRFKSKWYISLLGFLLSVWVMFMLNALYTVMAYLIITLIYLFVEHANKDKKGLVNIFKGSLFQLNRKLQVFMQRKQGNIDREEWRPAAICMSNHSLEREKVFDLMRWLSYQHGFGTYFHFIEDYYNQETYEYSRKVLEQLVRNNKTHKGALYIDTIISPSYTAALVQAIQTPSISGMENNMVVFEYSTHKPEELKRILSNFELLKAGGFDVAILAESPHKINYENGIHVWVKDANDMNTNFMILLGYIIMAHPNWRKSHIRIFITSATNESEEVKEKIKARIATGRIPITFTNIEMIAISDDKTINEMIEIHSKNAGLVVVGFTAETVMSENLTFFTDYEDMGDILFVNSSSEKEIL
jgi:amino acid transporter